MVGMTTRVIQFLPVSKRAYSFRGYLSVDTWLFKPFTKSRRAIDQFLPTHVEAFPNCFSSYAMGVELNKTPITSSPRDLPSP